MSLTNWFQFLSSLLHKTISKGKIIEVTMNTKVNKK